jgi:DNA-directed RNA polymerase specialized sigma24 family protein
MLLDAVIARWSKAQAEAVLIRLLLGRTQKEAGETLGVSQPAIAQRLRAANVDVLETLFARYETLIGRAIRRMPSNDSL